MDLFGDLPEPSAKDSVKSLYGDMPSQATETKPPDKEEVGKRKVEEDRSGNDVKKTRAVRYSLTPYLVERQGEREDMQDAHLIIKDYLADFTNPHPSIFRMAIFGVFDGHGGARASRFASENLHKNLQDKFPKGDITQVEKDIRKVFIDAFKKTDEDFLKKATKNKPVWKDGTTANVVLVINDTLYIANIGDSQAVLCRYKEDTNSYVPIPLSVPHNPSLYEERMRIQKQGGNVKDGRVMGVLEVSRSIGDGQYKKLGVTCVPDVKKCQLTDNDRGKSIGSVTLLYEIVHPSKTFMYVIVACDGLWKCFEPEDSIKFVNKILSNESIKQSDKKAAEDVRFETACNRLAKEAVLRFSGDNVTVLLIRLKKQDIH